MKILLFFVFVVPVFLAGAVALQAWTFMLGVGIVHHEWLTTVPTIGFWPGSFLVALAFSLMFSPLIAAARSSNSS